MILLTINRQKDLDFDLRSNMVLLIKHTKKWLILTTHSDELTEKPNSRGASAERPWKRLSLA